MFHFTVFPALQTPRLRLREMTAEDAAAVFAIRGDYEVTRLNIGAAYTELQQAHDLIAAMHDAYIEQREVRWGITRHGDDTVLGMVGFNYWHRIDRRASVGFDLRRDCWGQGIMREALQAVLHFGFTEMELNRIEADASAENTASIRLLARLGFQQEGLQREQYFEEGAFHDLMLFSLLRREAGTLLPPVEL
jgi:[ribosomal protein S5]-alanine N-acetyltransferase